MTDGDTTDGGQPDPTDPDPRVSALEARVERLDGELDQLRRRQRESADRLGEHLRTRGREITATLCLTWVAIAAATLVSTMTMPWLAEDRVYDDGDAYSVDAAIGWEVAGDHLLVYAAPALAVAGLVAAVSRDLWVSRIVTGIGAMVTLAMLVVVQGIDQGKAPGYYTALLAAAFLTLASLAHAKVTASGSRAGRT